MRLECYRNNKVSFHDQNRNLSLISQFSRLPELCVDLLITIYLKISMPPIFFGKKKNLSAFTVTIIIKCRFKIRTESIFFFPTEASFLLIWGVDLAVALQCDGAYFCYKNYTLITWQHFFSKTPMFPIFVCVLKIKNVCASSVSMMMKCLSRIRI